ncbi:SDR family oxidoreductase [Flavobacterium jejuense]|uniref:SDR family oxidoreductase n=1 Tax=Flavobacterium jejuense TaxID=1544455 RepID=A0ABX0INY5_9FLAO|nr:SDR family oxidoreductase [Flavobacterium jejuense]NHN25281.1 SDR family oxidoreductase [Flavobacterium jejuense]
MKKTMITGATGQYGKVVIDELIKKGVDSKSIYALVRDETKAENLKNIGVNIVIGDYSDYNSLISAFYGIDKLLFVSSGELENRIKQHLQVIKAAKKTGVKHILYTSQIHKTDSITSPMNFVMKSHLATENNLIESGIEYTILRNGLYLDMLPLFLGKNVLEKGIFLPAGEGKIAFALRNEMAEVAANIIISERHQNKIYNISLPGVSFTEIATIISEITNKNITYLSSSLDIFLHTMINNGMPKMYAEMIGGFSAAAKQGELEGGKSQMEKLLEKTPTSVKAFSEKMYN